MKIQDFEIGSPYSVAEIVFDEDDIDGCDPVNSF